MYTVSDHYAALAVFQLNFVMLYCYLLCLFWKINIFEHLWFC